MQKWLNRILFLSGLFALWEIGYQFELYNPAFISSPSQIFQIIFSISFWQLFWLDFFESISKILSGVLLGYILAHLFTLIAILSPFSDYLVRRFQQILKYIPFPTLIPFGILFFGISLATNIFLITVVTLIIILGHNFSILDKELKSYQLIKSSWRISNFSWFTNFLFPVSNFLSYRIISTLIIWVLSTEVIIEMLLGGKFGIGVRLLQFQQLYKVAQLYSYLILILILSYMLEKVCIAAFCRIKFDWKKISSVLLISTLFGGFLYSNWFSTKVLL
ncbi:MAG: hypothetical protein HC932_02235, partial [Thermales bacterium]|nr:hypothetical protein [Thermales bacterium]